MKTKGISSRSNPLFRKFRSLLKGHGIKKHGATLLSGPKQVKDILRELPDRCTGLILTRKQDIPEEIIPEGLTLYYLDSDLFREIDIYGTDQPILLVSVGQFPLWTDEEWPAGCTLFVPFQDPVNVGAVIRSALAFGAPRVVILREAAHPFHHKSIRGAGSAIFRIPIFQGPSIRELGGTRGTILTLSPRGKDISEFNFPSAFGLLPGIEGPGLPDNLKGLTSLRIPMVPGIESLNSALATGIALYLWRKGIV